MIKNVVLDIGNVLVSFYPDIYISQFTLKYKQILFCSFHRLGRKQLRLYLL